MADTCAARDDGIAHGGKAEEADNAELAPQWRLSAPATLAVDSGVLAPYSIGFAGFTAPPQLPETPRVEHGALAPQRDSDIGVPIPTVSAPVLGPPVMFPEPREAEATTGVQPLSDELSARVARGGAGGAGSGSDTSEDEDWAFSGSGGMGQRSNSMVDLSELATAASTTEPLPQSPPTAPLRELDRKEAVAAGVGPVFASLAVKSGGMTRSESEGDLQEAARIGRLGARLYDAASAGDFDAVERLVHSFGAPLDWKRPKTQANALYAAARGSDEVVSTQDKLNQAVTVIRLLRYGAVEAPTSSGRLPIHGAVLNNNPLAVIALAASGRTLSAPDEAGLTPLELAAQRKQTEVTALLDSLVQLLLPGVVDETDETESSALSNSDSEGDAASRRARNAARLRKAALNKFIHAAKTDKPANLVNAFAAATRCLRRQGLVFASAPAADSVIHAVATRRFPGFLDGCCVPKSRNTPLHIAASHGNATCAAALVGTGAADVGVRNKKGETPVVIAARKGSTDVLVALAAGGARFDVDDGLLDAARSHSREMRDVVETLSAITDPSDDMSSSAGGGAGQGGV